MRSVCIYPVFRTDASLDPAEFTITQHPVSPFTPRHARSLPFQEGVCWHLTFDETPPLMPEGDSEDEEDLLTADLDDPVWSKEPVLDSWEYLCILKMPRSTTLPNQPPPQPNQGVPTTPTPQPDQGVPATPPQPEQIEMPPNYELMELDIPEDILDLLDVPEEVMSNIDTWAQDVLNYQW